MLATACGKKNTPGPVVPTNSGGGVYLPPAGGALSEDSLHDSFKQRFPEAVADGTLKIEYGSAGVDREIIDELGIMNIKTTAELAAIVPVDFHTKGFAAVKASESPTTNVAGLVRDLLIMHDVRGYFTKAWRNTWVSSGRQDFPAPAAYGVDFGVMEELGVFGGGGGDPCEDMSGGDGDPCGDPCGD